jgi:hypothetical protein
MASTWSGSWFLSQLRLPELLVYLLIQKQLDVLDRNLERNLVRQ